MRNRKVVLVVRVLFGLFMLFSGVSGFMASVDEMQGVPQEMITATKNLQDSGLFHMIKITEIVAGLMLIVGFLPALALLFIAPIAVGIVVFNAFIAPMYVISGIIVCAFTAFLGYAYWDKYRAIFAR
ncbi:MAG: DoxX family membrane protein [Patescibacteria group bacterium]